MVKAKKTIGMNEKTGELKIIREGKNNRELIYDFIFDNRNVGTKAGAIIDHIGLSKEAVFNHLEILLKEKRIYKKGIRYYPEISIQNEFAAFGHSMREGLYLLLDKKMIESASDKDLPYNLKGFPRLKLHQKVAIDIPNKILPRYNFEASFIKSPKYLMRMLTGPITSQKYCQTSFGIKESLEKCLFEFANRIGAYIIYIFLQSLHPLRKSKLDDKDRSELCKTLIEKAISIDDLFTIFRDLLTQIGLTDCNPDSNEYEKLFELSGKNFEAITMGLQNVYPNIYIGFENRWLHVTLNTLALHTWLSRSPTCEHEWNKRELFKYGSSHYCKKCHRYSDKLPK